MKQIIIILALGVVVLAFAVGLYINNNRMVEIMNNTARGIPTWNEANKTYLTDLVEAGLEEALAYLEDLEFETADALFRSKVIEPPKLFLEYYPSNHVEKGVTLETWDARNRSNYFGRVKAKLEPALEALKAGRIPPAHLDDLVSLNPECPDLQPLYDQRRADIEQARLARATNFFRVVIEGPDTFPELRRAIEASMRAKLESTNGYQVVVGRPYSDAEDVATPRTLNIGVFVEFASYEIKRFSVQGPEVDWAPALIPAFAKLKFTMAGAGGKTMTSWDALKNEDALLEPPKLISQNSESIFMKQYRQRLADRMSSVLSTNLPEFNLVKLPEDLL